MLGNVDAQAAQGGDVKHISDNVVYGSGNTDYELDRRRQEEDELVDAAMRDILAGRFDTGAVHAAMKLGHHDDHDKLKTEYAAALAAARSCGATR